MAAIGLGLAVIDYVVQYRKTARQLRMTKQEVKEDSKASEGNPHVRGAIRRRQRQMARNRMLAAVARADAVVLNPTHFAVAVSYVRGRGAPKVVAKGVDFLALRIREEATVHRVPLVEDPPLARALYVACEVEQEIPTELYEAVARLLTFIYSLKASGRATPHRRCTAQARRSPARLELIFAVRRADRPLASQHGRDPPAHGAGPDQTYLWKGRRAPSCVATA